MAYDLRTRRLLARGISPRLARLWRNRYFAGTGGVRGVYVAPEGYVVLSRSIATSQPRFAVVVAGASTPASVAVSGSDVTFNSATNASSVATSTAKDLVRAIQANAAASALVSVGLTEGDTGATVVSARALTALAPNQP